MYKYAYLHGFSSSNQSRKGKQIKEYLHAMGIDLLTPSIHQPSFSQFTISDWIKYFVELDKSERAKGANFKWRFIGSSMGAYLALRFAHLYPERVDRLLLLCPGFAIVERWTFLLGEKAMDWKMNGSIKLSDFKGGNQSLHYAFMEDANKHPPFPDAKCPTLIIHGIHDKTVPIVISKRYIADHKNARLLEVDDDHDLQKSVPFIIEQIAAFFQLPRPKL